MLVFIMKTTSGKSISRQNRITKEWEINEDYRPKAVELGLDEKSAYETFTNMEVQLRLVHLLFLTLMML